MSNLINKTLDEVRADLLERIAQVQQDGWLPQQLSLNKGVVRGMIELWAWGLYQLYLFLRIVLQQAFATTATGAWLDLHCLQVGVKRLLATRGKGVVYFFRVESSGNVPIPAGRIVKTLPDGAGNVYRFITTEEAVLPDGSTEVAVVVEAEEYGTVGNVVAGQISEIATVVPGVDAVENRSGWLTGEGADKENDGNLRERYTLAWMDVNGATKYAYESWTRSVVGVVAVKIMDQHPRGQGTVDVVIRGTAGLPTQDLIDAVDVVVQEKRPINDDVLVKEPTAVLVDINARLELLSGDPLAILAEVETRIKAMFLDPAPVANVVPLQIGEDLTIDRLVAVIMAVSGIKKILWDVTSGDASVPIDGLAVLQSINLSYVWATDI